jgi:hypothetical protein
MSFNQTQHDGAVKAFIFEDEKSVVFLKLYLITKEQMANILRITYGVKEDETAIMGALKNLTHIGTLLIILGAKVELSKNNTKFSDYNILKCVGELDNILIYSITSSVNENISPPETDYLRNIYLGLKKSFHPYSEYLIMYYVYRIEGVKSYYSITQLKDCFFKSLSNSESKISTEKIPSHGSEELNMALNSDRRHDILCETIKCTTCNASPYVGTPEKDHINQYNYVFDLHHLPVFDENTGELFWSSNEANWKLARESILRSEEIQNGKSLSLNHGSLVSLTTSFANKQEDDNNLNTEQKWASFKKEHSGTFIEELNNLLKNFEK